MSDTHLTILLVGADNGVGDTLRSHLGADQQISIRLAPTLGKGFMALKTTDDIDLVLVDLALPDAPGAESVAKLREANADVPMLALSDAKTDGMAAVRAGAQDHIGRNELTGSHLARTLRYAVDRFRLAHRVEALAHHDPATGVPNRTFFQGELSRAVARCHRNRVDAAIVWVSLDRFRLINDRHGHTYGDQVLRAAAEQLTRSVRASDVVARVGGDEFAVLLEDIDTPTRAVAVARKIQRAFAKKLLIGEEFITQTARLGVALCSTAGPDEATWIRAATTAAAAANDKATDRLAVHTRDMEGIHVRRLEVEDALQKKRGFEGFHLAYQPIFAANGTTLVSHEALLRWRCDPLGGMVSPGEFVPVAEASGLISDIGGWVLREACKTMAARESGRVAVNVSRQQLVQKVLNSQVDLALRSSGLAPDRLEIELTEVSLADPILAKDALRKLKDQGVRLVIDDFGTGSSSLSDLARLPVDALKIDGEFVRNCRIDQRSARIVEAITQLAHTLGLEVVGEEIETEDQRDFLKESGCDLFQGYLLGRPGEL
jgi:diguanylate cyclase (GGDEF)-like protein